MTHLNAQNQIEEDLLGNEVADKTRNAEDEVFGASLAEFELKEADLGAKKIVSSKPNITN